MLDSKKSRNLYMNSRSITLAEVSGYHSSEKRQKMCDHFLTKTGQNGIIQPLLTDLYQITMAYAYWKNKKASDYAVFELFFRRNPFHGEFTIFAGLEECLKFINCFHYSDSDIDYLKSVLPTTIETEFFDFLRKATANEISVYAVPEGTAVFPRVPLIRIEGPLIVAQLLETTLLNLVNYASLMATNAARYRIVAGNNVSLFEFGLRRAQGPDGGLSASKYSYMGGFDGTSNVLAGKLFNIPVNGTHAHAYISSYTGFKDLPNRTVEHKKTKEEKDLLAISCNYRNDIAPLVETPASEASDAELAAFVSYAIAFPDGFMALVDTYDVKRSGLLNFCAVAMALYELGYYAIGIRIDSGDLAYLSHTSREYFKKVSAKYNLTWFANLKIVASNDINEETIISLNEQNHNIDCFGIGTHLVTCQKQPALGCIYKLVEINRQPRIKLSQEMGKLTMPGRKTAFRLYGGDGKALIDLLQTLEEDSPQVGHKVLCRHPFEEAKRAYVIPSKVESLHKLVWKDGQIVHRLPSLLEIRNKVEESLGTLRNDIKRSLNPTPYKVAVSENLYSFIHDLWLQNAPIGELS